MFDYPLLEVLQTIEREENFERAAKTMGVSKSHISQRLRLLEERMGATTVCRDTTQTTHFGNMLCRHYEDVMLREQSFLKTNAGLFNMKTPTPSVIKIAVGDDSLSSWFRDVINSEYEGREIAFLDIVLLGVTQSKPAMENREVHAALTAIKAPVTGYESHALGRHIYRATASPDFVKRFFPNGVSAQALANAPSLQFSEPDLQRNNWSNQALGLSQIAPTTILPSSHGILNVCLEGGAWAINSALLADKHIESGKLVEIIPGEELFFDLYWHVSQQISVSIKGLTDAVFEHSRKHLKQMQASSI